MKKILLTLFSLFSLTTAFAADTQTYVRTDYGLGRFKSEKMDALNVNPSGSTFSVSFGSRMSYVELGLFYKNFSFSSDINHDGIANKISHKGKSFGLDMSVFLNNHFSLRLGYAIHNYKQKVDVSQGATTDAAIKSIYGLNDDTSSSNFFYGANIDLFGGKRYDVYASVLQFPMGEQSTLTAQVGIRIYMNSSFADFFGR